MLRLIPSRVACLLLSVVVAACEEEPAARLEAVPNNAIKKSDLAGEWVSSNTAIHVPENTGWSFEGSTNFFERSKLRWEVQEDVLVGYQSFETVKGLDTNPEAELPKTGYVPPGTRCFEVPSGKELPLRPDSQTGERGHAGEPNVVCRDPQDVEIDCFPYRGEVFAIYEIKRHFDQRVVSGRVVVDETAPWYERSFVEVDWSKNLFESAGFAGGSGLLAFLEKATVVGIVDPGQGHRDAFTTRRAADGSLDYFDFVNRLHVEPPHEIVGEGVAASKQYLCTFARECSAAEIAVRVAYRRVDPSTEFEPRSYPRDEQARFPMFRSERVGYNPYIGGAVSLRVQLAQQLPIWKAVYQRDDQGVIVRDDKGEPIVLPHAEREVEPIVFYLTGEWPDALTHDAGTAIDTYDAVLREAVDFLRGTEGEPPGLVTLDYNGRVKHVALSGNEDACDALTERSAARRGTLSGGEPACEITRYVPGVAPSLFAQETPAEWSFDSAGEVAVLGDLLHHKLHWVAAAQLNGPLGYGPAVVDPETGMVLAGMAAIYGNALNTYTTYALDVVNLLNGRVTLKALSEGHAEPSLQAQSGAGFESFDPGDFLAKLAHEHGQRSPRELEELFPTPSASEHAASPGAGMANLEMLMGSSPAVDALFAYELDQEASFGASRDALAEERGYQSLALSNNISLPSFYEESAIQFAGRFVNRPIVELGVGGPVWHELRSHILADLIVHELGHTFGLRHNFKGSHDALNYEDEYWDLRKETLKPASEVTTVADVFTHHVRSETQIAKGMDLHAGSSVMDYNHVSSAIGLGRYDRAALLSNYAGAAEVFDVDPATIPASVRAELASQVTSEAVTAPTFLELHHYSQAPYLLGPSLDDGLLTLRSRRLVPWQELKTELMDNSDGAPVPVPYEQCSDEDRDGAVRGCALFDSGADDLERALDIAGRLEFDGMFQKFRRGRAVGLSPAKQYGRLVSRYLLPLRSIYQHGVGNFLAGLTDFATLDGGTWLAGSFVGFNQLVRMLVTPEYGEYYTPVREGDDCRHGSYSLAGDAVVPMGIGHRFEPRYDDSGEYGAPAYIELGDRYSRRAALVVMTMDADPVGLLDGSDLAFGYNELFSYYIDRAVTDLFLNDMELVGPRLQADGNTVFPSFVDAMQTTFVGVPPEGCVLEMPNDERERQVSVLLSSILLSTGQSLVFHHRARVFRVGTAEQPTIPMGLSMASFVNPSTGIEYGALVTTGADFMTHEPGLAARLVSRGEALASMLALMPENDPERPQAQAAFAQTVDDAEFLRSTFNLVDSVTLGAP